MKKIVFFLLLIFSSQAGCTLTDPEVMEMLQALQAQNDKLLEEITSMKGQLTALDGKYQAILAGLADNKKDLEALKAQVEALKTQIADQLKKIDQLTAQLTQQGADIVKLSAELAAVKASLADLLLQFEQLVNNQSNQIFYDKNGTIKCPTAKVGEKGFVNGKQYEAVDRDLLIKRRDEGADLTCVCTSLVTDMKALFGSFTVQKITFNQPIGGWDVSNVTTMHSMFLNSTFNQPIGNWDVSKVEDMTQLFGSSPFNQPIGNWNVGKVKSMLSMFAYSEFNQPIGNWDVSNVVDMLSMFAGSPFNYPLANWNVSKVKRMTNMFAGKGNPSLWPTLVRSQFNQPIENWDVSNVESMSNMFYYSNYNQPLNNWNVSKVTDMNSMFQDSKFNQPIGNWNVGNVKLMFAMFQNSQFNQNISNWCVTKVECFPGAGPCNSEPQDFSTNSPLGTSSKPKWGTCPSSSDATGNLVDKYPAGSVFGAVGPTIIVDVTNPRTGKTWMDRNLGASRAATSSTDVESYGDLYQWGRGVDGHQLKTSTTTTTQSSTNQPGNSNFILVLFSEPADWRSPQNTNLWQGVAGVNNPCPSGYRIPTEAEWETERSNWSANTSVGALASPLKLPLAGARQRNVGSLFDVGTVARYWSSTVSDTFSRSLLFNSISAGSSPYDRAYGFSVRCIKN